MNTENLTNQIQIFKNSQFGEVRVVIAENGEPVFCLLDVAKVLDLIPSKLSQRLGDDVLSKYPINDSLGREQMANFVNEDGLYDAVLDSRKPEAKQFRKWVTSEVLPSIRKHGLYATPQTVEAILADPDFGIRLLTNLKEERNMRMAAEKQIEADKPKVVFANAVEASGTSCLIGELAKILRQNGIEIGQKRLFEWLRGNHYLCSQYGQRNIPTQKAMESGLFEIKKRNVELPNGATKTVSTTVVTGKGQVYFINKFITSQKTQK